MSHVVTPRSRVVSLKDGWIVFSDDCALGLKGESLWDGSWSVEST